MYSSLDDTTKRRMMQAKALSMEAKGGRLVEGCAIIV